MAQTVDHGSRLNGQVRVLFPAQCNLFHFFSLDMLFNSQFQVMINVYFNSLVQSVHSGLMHMYTSQYHPQDVRIFAFFK